MLPEKLHHVAIQLGQALVDLRARSTARRRAICELQGSAEFNVHEPRLAVVIGDVDANEVGPIAKFLPTDDVVAVGAAMVGENAW